MDFIAPEPIDSTIFTLMGVGGIILLGVFAFGFFVLMTQKRVSKWLAVVVALSMVGGMVLALMGDGLSDHAKRNALQERDSRVIAAIEEIYELELTESELAKLNYPKAEPESNFEAFGSIDKITKAGDEKLLERKLYLVWDEDSFGIFQSENGEDFVPLEAQN